MLKEILQDAYHLPMYVLRSSVRLYKLVRGGYKTLRANLRDMISFESYYRFKKQFLKYFKKIVIPSIVFTILIMTLYVTLGWLFRWRYMSWVPIAVFLGMLVLMIVLGCLRGESRQDEYYADR